MREKIIKFAYLIFVFTAFIIALPSISAVTCPDNIIGFYYDPNTGNMVGPFLWQDILNTIERESNVNLPAEFCNPSSITYLLSNDHSKIKYLMTANSKYITFRWDEQSHRLLQQGDLSDFRAENGVIIFPSNMRSPDSITSVILGAGTGTYRNYLFMTQGNFFSTLQYNTETGQYTFSSPVNIAEHFQRINKPVPAGFESFNAVAEVYNLRTGEIVYFVVSGDGTKYAYYLTRSSTSAEPSNGNWYSRCGESCPVSNFRDSQGRAIFSRIIAATPFSRAEFSSDVFRYVGYANLYYFFVGIRNPSTATPTDFCSQTGNYFTSPSCTSTSMKGDVNNDRRIDNRDVCTILRSVATSTTTLYTTENTCCFDVDNDNLITSSDAALASSIIVNNAGINTELCSRCSIDDCGTCASRDQCVFVGCAWGARAGVNSCSSTCISSVECATGSYCSSSHCCPNGQVWDPNARGPGIGECTSPEELQPCTPMSTESFGYSPGMPYSPTEPIYGQACCFIRDELGIQNEFRYRAVRTY